MATTPRLRASSVSEASFTKAPRSLKELVTWRFSYLTKTSAPARPDSFGAGSMGVRSTTPSITRRAASMSARVSFTKSVLFARDLAREWDAPCRKRGRASSGPGPAERRGGAAACGWPLFHPPAGCGRGNGMHHAASAAGLPAAQGLRNGGVARRLAFGLFFTHLRVERPDGTRLRPASRGGRTAMAIDIKPHAYDPVMNPELFEGVLSRRILAFVIDLVILAIPVVLASIFIFAFGIVTL